MTIVVTGATGYVGSALLERLCAAGVDVRAIVRDTHASVPAGVERVVVDLAAPQELPQALRGADTVVHCAAEQRSPSRALHRLVNVDGTRALLEAATAAGVRRVVHLSSVAVYPRRDDQAPPIVPEDGVDPFPELRDAYAWSKIAAERWIALHRRAGTLDVVTLRLGIVYGRGRDFVARVWRRIAGPVAVIAGSPHMLLPLVHVDDVTEAVWRVVNRPHVAEPILHVVGPEVPSQASYLAQRRTHGHARIVPIYVSLAGFQLAAERGAWTRALRPPQRPSRAYTMAWTAQRARYDLDATDRALDWRPGIDLAKGLSRAATATTVGAIAGAGGRR